MNNLTIAIVHDQKLPVVKYGGTERVAWALGEALLKLGHKVVFIIPKGSKCPFAEVIPRPKQTDAIHAVIPNDVDIVHSFNHAIEDCAKPQVITLEGNGKAGQVFHPNTIFVSKDHAKRHNSEVFVHNGLNPDDYPLPDATAKENFCFFLAKARWEVKNIKGALAVARKAAVPIAIMGGWRPSFTGKVRWLGMVGGSRKYDVLRRGSALIFPVRWNEPFGLAMIEALFTGSPVFGTPYGSLPELIPEEVGFLSNNADELAEALKNYRRYNPSTCRNYALKNFTHLTMANNYLAYYDNILKGAVLNKESPRTLVARKHGELLPFTF